VAGFLGETDPKPDDAQLFLPGPAAEAAPAVPAAAPPPGDPEDEEDGGEQQQQAAPPPDAPLPPPPVPAAVFVGMSSYLAKSGARMHSGIRRRWFAMEGADIHYYVDDSCHKAKGVIHLDAQCSLSMQEGGEAANFQLHTPSRTFQMAADTHEHMLQWLSALKNNIGVLRGA
jgi:hypothetical protein